MMSPIITKTYRVVYIFQNANQFKAVTLTLKQVLVYTVAGTLPLVIFALFQMFLINDEPLARHSLNDTFYMDCPQHEMGFMSLFLGFCYIIALLYYSFSGRNLPNDFNEIVHLFYISAFEFCFALIGIGMIIITDGTGPDTSAVIICMILVLTATVVSTALLVPKCMLIFSGAADRKASLGMERESAKSAKTTFSDESKQLESAKRGLIKLSDDLKKAQQRIAELEAQLLRDSEKKK